MEIYLRGRVVQLETTEVWSFLAGQVVQVIVPIHRNEKVDDESEGPYGTLLDPFYGGGWLSSPRGEVERSRTECVRWVPGSPEVRTHTKGVSDPEKTETQVQRSCTRGFINNLSTHFRT